MSHKNLISFIVLFTVAGSAGAVDKTVDTRRTRALKLYSAAPAAFIENAGQITDPTVRYVFRGSGANIFHTTRGPVFQLFKRKKLSEEVNRHPRLHKRAVIR